MDIKLALWVAIRLYHIISLPKKLTFEPKCESVFKPASIWLIGPIAAVVVAVAFLAGVNAIAFVIPWAAAIELVFGTGLATPDAALVPIASIRFTTATSIAAVKPNDWFYLIVTKICDFDLVNEKFGQYSKIPPSIHAPAGPPVPPEAPLWADGRTGGRTQNISNLWIFILDKTSKKFWVLSYCFRLFSIKRKVRGFLTS